MLQRGLSFLFGAFCVALISTKITILTINAPTVPVSEFLFFLPTFFLPDVVAICVMRLLLRASKGYVAIVAAAVGIVASLVVVGAASSQLGFYYETGGELEWHEASTFARDKEALKVLLSGSATVLGFGCVILFTAACLHTFLYRIVGEVLVALAVDIVAICRWFLDRYRCDDRLTVSDTDSEAGDIAYRRNSNDGAPSNQRLLRANGDIEKADPSSPSSPPRKAFCLPPAFPLARVVKAVGSAFLAMALIVRPPVPFNHMSVTLPASLLEVFDFHEPPMDCFERSRRKLKNAWPFPDLVVREKWQGAKGHFKGWAPGRDSRLANKYRHRVPKWLMDNMPHGFQRFDPEIWKPEPPPPPPPPPGHHHGPPHGPHGMHRGPPPPPHPPAECPPEDLRISFYNPVEDPMKITNLDNDLLDPLKDALGSVRIKHVAIILMEALRVELFPIQKNSRFYDMVMEANDGEADVQEVNRRLAYLTPNIDSITGGIGGFDHSEDSEEFPRNWQDQTKEGFGGINVIGATTASTLSTKSFAANLCGTWPMAVENFDEADTESYQPCLPQIMSLLNGNKPETPPGEGKQPNSTTVEDFTEYKWRTGLFESMTETFDRQDRFDKKLGWDKILALQELKKDTSRYKPNDPAYEKLGYLGFAEPVLEPYIRDFIAEAEAERRRMFMMHFTSITHHPWELPSWFNKTTYLPTKRHQDLDKYMNTIRHHDYWLGQLMKIFEETGIADETLVVFAGDHGQAFTEDNKKQGTYENGHISNFRIPITFRHPQLPRIQYEANATSISILPTILDLLINSGSLSKVDAETASDLLYDYEGQSVLRPYRPAQDGRRAWNFAIVNSGAGILGVTSADTHWRLVLPLTKKFAYRMTDLLSDPGEADPVVSWSLSGMVSDVRRKYGEDAAAWAAEAESVAQWWLLERKRLWRHT
ncbi:alkaline-phosphatase-like protein [Plectosphaerella plurivora]|uniref:Alkaline-phosphatase-like protein n=1 Tax=Plectosphaerella plurivora TaxID=936078 RepID=A0A9P9ACT5_9PEZI|nr:alkaline-phosphatase-like protein [Plectosphaerella plurivora]